LGGWQDPQGFLAVTLFGVASVCAELRVSAAPAIKIAAAIVAAHTTALCILRYEVAGAFTYCIVHLPLFAVLKLTTAAPMATHSITSSARKMTDGGIVSPSALAALRLTTSSNLTGRSTGKSAGFAPFKILSTYAAARLCMSA
jgi:hypothetical protein